MSSVIVENLRFAVRKTDGTNFEVLKEVTFSANHQEFVCILGPSGCGKTTLLNIIAGLQRNFSGTLSLTNSKGDAAPEIGYVFQTPRLLNWITLRRNVMFVLKANRDRGGRDADYTKTANDCLAMVGLADSADKYPLQCSEGEKARVGIARALAIDPDLILMDEPFSHLDEITARSMRTELLRIWSDKKKTVIFVTHNAHEAAFLADKVYILSAKPTSTIGLIEIDIPRPRMLEDYRVLEYQQRILKGMGI